MKRCFLMSVIVSILAFGAGTAAAKATYVGTKGCDCHKPEIADWNNTAHAQAFESLRPGKKREEKIKVKLDPEKDYTVDEKCIGCHATGYKEEGGFKELRLNPGMAGVGCESCHGPGSEYADLHRENGLLFSKKEAIEAGAVYSSLDEKVCRKCHGHKDSPYQPEVDEKYRFDLEKGLKRTETFHKYYEQLVTH